MRIALVTQNADLELDLRPRAEAAALAAAGHDVVLVGGTRSVPGLRAVTDERVAIAAYPMPREARGAAGQVVEQGTSFARMTRTLLALARRNPIDVVHASNPPDNAWLALSPLRAVQRRRPRFVFDQHDVAPVLIEEKFGAGAHMRAVTSAARSLERRSFSHADLVIFANAEYERRARDEGLLAGPCAVVPNGWSLPEAEPRADWRAGARFLVVYVGAINEQDCVEHLVEAVASLPEPESVRVCVAGDGAAREPAARRARELGVAGSFRWLGWVRDRSALGSLVRSGDVCVAPEVDSEFNRLASFVKLVEYMSAGAATVAHRLAQNERLCGDTVRYADDGSAEALGAAIRQLLEDRAAAAALGARARARFAERVAWESVGAPRLVEAYGEAFGSSGAYFDPRRRRRLLAAS